MVRAKEKQLVPVSLRGVIQRINRRLAEKHGKFGSPPTSRVQLKKSRGLHAVQNLGDYYLLDVYSNTIVNHHLDLEDLARDHDAPSPWEKIADDDEKGGD